MREQGVVKYWVMDRGFGFIARSGRRRDAFAHHTEIENAPYLTVNSVVEFDVQEDPKGPHALNVRVLSEPI